MQAVGVGAAASAGGLLNIYGYNRSAFSTNIQVQMNRRHQKQSIFINQSGLFREDVRELISAAVTRQQNYVTVTTLVLGMACTCYGSSVMPSGTTAFLRTAFLCCTGASLLYLVMSVLAALTATQLAATFRRDFLVHVVRLPVEEMMGENRLMECDEMMENFEHQRFRKMFRLPGIRALMGKKGKKSRDRGAEGDGAEGDGAHEAQGNNPDAWGPEGSSVSPKATDNEEEIKKLAYWMGRMMERKQKYFTIFNRKEREWTTMSAYALFFGWLGISHLLQAHGYYSVALATDTLDWWTSVIIQFLVTLANGALIVGLNEVLGIHAAVSIQEVLINSGGQLCIFITVCCTNHWSVARLCVPLVFCFHFIVNSLSTKKLVKVLRFMSPRDMPCTTHTWDRGSGADSASYQSFSDDASESGSESTRSQDSSASSEADSSASSDPGCWSSVRHAWKDDRPLVFFGNRMVSFTFLLCTVWAAGHSCCASPLGAKLAGTCNVVYGDAVAGEGQDFWVRPKAPAAANASWAPAFGGRAPTTTPGAPAAPSASGSQRRLHGGPSDVARRPSSPARLGSALAAAQQRRHELELQVKHLETELLGEQGSHGGELLGEALQDLAWRLGRHCRGADCARS